jgi:hypothetical protein
MVALVSAETVLLVLLVVLVAGLLRSHAEILRRLGPAPEDQGVSPSVAQARAVGELEAAPLSGATPAGDAITLDFSSPGAKPTLLAFLTSGCSSCQSFWQTLAEPRLPAEVQIVIVAHGAERERPSRLRSLAPDGIPVVMSTPAWEDYRVPGAPYFVLVDGGIRGEGVATSWQALSSLVSDALDEQRESAGMQRGMEVDATLAAGGIGPGHPSLYPGNGSATR